MDSGGRDCKNRSRETSTGGSVYSVTIGHAPNGNVTSANDLVNGNWTYTYDAFNRLATANGGTNNNYVYGYDQYGNRWSQTGPYSMSLSFSGGNNRVDGYGYTANGNLQVDNQGCTYTYDAENRITGVSGGTCTSATFGYDGLGRRISKMTSAGTKYYLYDRQDRPFVETTSATTWTRMELYAGSRHVGTYSGGPTGGTYFSYDDWLGTERVRTHMNGSTSETCTSLPFGDGQTCTGAEISPIHFTGKQRDTETGNDYFGARYYSSSLGRFVTPDWSKNPQGVPYADFAYPQSLNLYGYVQNNPLAKADADGHCGQQDGSQDCSQVKVQAQVVQRPQPVKNTPMPVNGRTITATGVSGKLMDTVTVNGKPAADVKVNEHNDNTVTKNGNPVKVNLVQGEASTNAKGQFADTISLLAPTDGAKTANNQVLTDLKTNAYSSTDRQILTLTLPNGCTCSATSTRTLTNAGPNGPSSTYTLTTTQPVVTPNN